MFNRQSRKRRRSPLVEAVLLILTVTFIVLLVLALHLPGELYLP